MSTAVRRRGTARHRGFDDRDDLVRQVATHVSAQVADDADGALRQEDVPFQALRRCLQAVVSQGAVLTQRTQPPPGADRAASDVPIDRYVEPGLAGPRAPVPIDVPPWSAASTDSPSFTSPVLAHRR